MVNAFRLMIFVIVLAVVIGSIMVTSAGDAIITINSPSDADTVNTKTITVSGTVVGDQGAVIESVTVNGELALGTGPEGGFSSWEKKISLREGQKNKITVEATDIFDHKTAKTITVFYNAPTPSPTPTPIPTLPPKPTPIATPKPTPIATPTPELTPTPTPELTPTPTPTPTPELTPTPTQETIDEILKNLPIGKVLFNPPKEMGVGETELVEVRITQNLMEDLTKGLEGPGELQIKETKVSTYMKVRLTGRNFDIDPKNGAEQIIESDKYTHWDFQVTPLKSGIQTLKLSYYVIIYHQGADRKKEYEVGDWEVNVKVTLRGWFMRYWEFIVGSLIAALVAALVALIIATIKKILMRRG